MRERLVLYGGTVYGVGATNECWELRTHARAGWARLSPPVPIDAPGPLFGAPAVVAPERREMFLLGNRGEAWSLSLDENPRWTLLAPSGSASLSSGLLRGEHDVAWDSLGRRLITFDTVTPWALDVDAKPPTWSRLPSIPDERYLRNYEALIVDPLANRLLLFGGNLLSPTGWMFATNELWALSLADGVTWERIDPAGETPPKTSSHGAVYDPARRRMLVVGRMTCGIRGCGGPTEVWEFALDGSRAWKKLATLGPDDPRFTKTIVLDAGGDRILNVDAVDQPDPTVSVLSLADLATSSLVPRGRPAVRRDFPSVAFDPRRNELFLYGGSELQDLWRIALGDCETNAARRPPRLEPAARAALAEAAVLAVRGTPLGGGRVRFDVTAGIGPGPVQLDVFDVAGRRRVTAATPARTGAPWSGELPSLDVLPAGVYLVRATQGGAFASARIVLLR